MLAIFIIWFSCVSNEIYNNIAVCEGFNKHLIFILFRDSVRMISCKLRFHVCIAEN